MQQPICVIYYCSIARLYGFRFSFSVRPPHYQMQVPGLGRAYGCLSLTTWVENNDGPERMCIMIPVRTMLPHSLMICTTNDDGASGHVCLRWGNQDASTT